MRVVVARAPVKRLIRVRKTVVDEMPDELIGSTVIREPALVPRIDEAHSAQEGQLVARDRQREVEGVRDVADSQLVMRERVHERESNRVRKQPEDLSRLPKHLRGGESVPSDPDFLRANDFGESALGICYHS